MAASLHSTSRPKDTVSTNAAKTARSAEAQAAAEEVAGAASLHSMSRLKDAVSAMKLAARSLNRRSARRLKTAVFQFDKISAWGVIFGCQGHSGFRCAQTSCSWHRPGRLPLLKRKLEQTG